MEDITLSVIDRKPARPSSLRCHEDRTGFDGASGISLPFGKWTIGLFGLRHHEAGASLRSFDARVAMTVARLIP